MERIVAYCGLLCTECPAYLATKAEDREALERLAAQWREEYNAPDLTVDNVYCEGCPGEGERKCGHCAECEIRACGAARGVANCGACPEYACEKIRGFLAMVPQARAVLGDHQNKSTNQRGQNIVDHQFELSEQPSQPVLSIRTRTPVSPTFDLKP